MLKKRILILKEASVISEKVANYLNDVIDDDLQLFEEKQSVLEMFTTHLAMATQRICTNQSVEELDDAIWNEVIEHPCFTSAQNLYEKIVKHAPCTYPEGERKFLMMHLCNLYQ